MTALAVGLTSAGTDSLGSDDGKGDGPVVGLAWSSLAKGASGGTDSNFGAGTDGANDTVREGGTSGALGSIMNSMSCC